MAWIEKRPYKCSNNSNFSYPSELTDTYTESSSNYTFLNTTSGSAVLYYYNFTNIPSNAVITEIITTVKYDFIGTISFRLCKDSTGHSSGQYTSIQDSATTVYSNDSKYKSATEEFYAPSEVITAINSDLGILRTLDRFSLRLYGKLANASSSHDKIYSVKVKVVYNNPRTITTSVSPSGGGTVSGGGSYYDGDSVTLTATPATGYQFTKWQKNGTDDGNTSATRTITVSEDATYTAVFTKKTYSISKSLSHAILSNSNTTIQHGSSYSSGITADTNYTIDTVTVTMGGTDITSTAYSNGAISIASVTGNISITVTTVSSRLPEVASVSVVPNPANAGQGLVFTVVFS